jgi:hypothetical protein
MNHSQISFLSSLNYAQQIKISGLITKLSYLYIIFPIMNLVSTLFSYEKNKYIIKEMEDRHINSHLNVPEE